MRLSDARQQREELRTTSISMTMRGMEAATEWRRGYNSSRSQGERESDAAFVKRLRLPVIIGDMSAGTTFDGLRLGSARALLAVTKDDMANLQCALLAQARAPGLRVVLRMFDPDLAARVERGTGIYLSRSVFALAAPAFVAAIFGRRPAAVLPIGAEVLQIVDLTAERETDVRTLEETCKARHSGRVDPAPCA
jgi:hypothetical protein